MGSFGTRSRPYLVISVLAKRFVALKDQVPLGAGLKKTALPEGGLSFLFPVRRENLARLAFPRDWARKIFDFVKIHRKAMRFCAILLFFFLH